MTAEESPSFSLGWEREWLRENPRRFSVYRRLGFIAWAAEANTPRVLASAQKVHVLAAFLELARADAGVLTASQPLAAVELHHIEGTDAGAHRLALLADGIQEGQPDRVIPLTTLLMHMLYYSSNAAADALQDAIQERGVRGERTSTLPPHMSAQFRAALADHLDSTHTTSEKVGTSAYRNSVAYLTELMTEILRHRHSVEGFDPIRYLPRLATKPIEIRGKRGQLPGYRAAALICEPGSAVPGVGAYALDVEGVESLTQPAVDSLERVLLGAAAGLLDIPHLAPDGTKNGSSR